MEAKIPGIGRYSAGAICSIAYNECAPVVSLTRIAERHYWIGAMPADNLA